MGRFIHDRMFQWYRVSRCSILASIGVIMFAGIPAGCTVSREIVEIDPPQQPPLQRLEQNLDYEDPDAGEPDYVRTE